MTIEEYKCLILSKDDRATLLTTPNFKCFS